MYNQPAPTNLMKHNEMIHVPVENTGERKGLQVFWLQPDGAGRQPDTGRTLDQPLQSHSLSTDTEAFTKRG